LSYLLARKTSPVIIYPNAGTPQPRHSREGGNDAVFIDLLSLPIDETLFFSILTPQSGVSPFCSTVERNKSISPPPISRGRNEPPRREKDDGPNVNGSITARQVRVVDANGEMRGVMAVRDAIALAEESGLDLVEISPNAEPPVCKILDYGKYKFEMQKKAAEARKKQKVVELKEIKLRPTIDDHDFFIKMKAATAFLKDGDKVKVSMRFRGREMAHQEIAYQVFNRVKGELDAYGKIESDPSFEGRQMIMVMSAK
jgi:translation initiation factor IF-3